MIKALQSLEPVQAMLTKANDILGYDLLDICLNGPEDKLSQTKFCQPALYVAGLAAWEQLKVDQPEKASKFMSVAGLSLGEYTALTAAGVFDFETGLKLVKARGEAMEYETTKPSAPKQSMLSVAGLEESVLQKLCKESVKSGEVCKIANYLFPKGFSVAGDAAAIARLEPKVKDAGALQAKILKTSGAFHTSIMAGAKDSLLQTLRSMKDQMQSPSCKVYMNITAEAIDKNTSVDDIIEMLGKQLVSPVLWEQSMVKAIKDGCQEFFECGPSKQLKAMMKRIEPKAFEKMSNVQA